jgi:hypothetical protein
MTLTARLSCILSLIAIVPIAAQAEDESDWTDRLSVKGDLRLRYEGIDEDGEESRNRSRYRARLAVVAEVHPNVKIVMELASDADNPVSRNVTFDGGFTTKDIGLDLAYVEWAATENLTVYGGKMKNPLYRAGGAPLIWDGDLNPEGIAAKFSKGAFFGTAASFSVEERSSSSDSLLTAVQMGAKVELSDNLKLTVGVGYFAYSNTIGNEPFYNGKSKGNSVDIDGNYIYEYKDTEVFAQLDTKVGDWPLSVYAQWVSNSEADEEDSGYAVGARIGAAKAKGDMEFSWTYQDIEADAVIATFNDSDFGGGGTDASGHILKGKYAVSKSISLAGTYFINEIDRFQGTEHDFNRFQLDVQFSFK